MELSNYDGYQLQQKFLKFFPDADAAKRFAAAIPAAEFSPATIKERLLKVASIEPAFAAFSSGLPTH